MVLFILVPLAEILVIVQVGSAIGGWWTAGLLVADSLLGAWLLRVEGRRAWQQFRTALQEGRWPGDEVAQGALIIVGGTLLLTPGFLTDILGFLFLVAPTRRFVSRRLRARVGEQMVGEQTVGGATGARTPPSGAGGAGPHSRSGRTTTGGRTGSSGPQPGRGRQPPVELDVEVVEIRREQGPRPVTGASREGPAGRDDQHDDDDVDDPGGDPGDSHGDSHRDSHGGSRGDDDAR